MNHSPDNLTRFHAVIAGLTPDQSSDAAQHLLGAVSCLVPAEDWDAAVERAVRFATGTTR